MNELLARVSSFFVEPAPARAPEPRPAGASEPTLARAPEPTLAGAPEPTLAGAPEPTLAGAPEPTLAGAPEPTLATPPAPAPAPGDSAAVAVPGPASIALLCRPGDALALGSALALGLARRARSAVSVVGLWRPGDPPRAAARAPAGRPARRLASSLRARDVPADPAGRVVRATLPAEPDDALASAERIYAATDAPVVLVIAGARTDAVDAMLARQDALLVAATAAGPEADPVAELAAQRLVALGPPVEMLTPALPPMTRALAAAGLAAPALRTIVDLGRVVA